MSVVSRLELNLKEPLQARVGIATGVVVVSNVDGENAQEAEVVGVTPNLAARLQAIANAGSGCRVAEYVGAHGRFLQRRRPWFDLGQGIWPVRSGPGGCVETKAVTSRFEVRHGATSRDWSGRTEEIALLMRRWKQAESGNGNVVLISGEPGIGNRRIVHTCWSR